MGYSSTAANITNSKRRPSSRQLVLSKCTTVVRRLLVVIRDAECNGSSPSHHVARTQEFQSRVAGMPQQWAEVCSRHRVAGQTRHLQSLTQAGIIRTWRGTGKFRLVKLQQICHKYVTWMNVLVLYTINSEILFKRSLVFKCYWSNRTTMTSKERDGWRKCTSKA